MINPGLNDIVVPDQSVLLLLSFDGSPVRGYVLMPVLEILFDKALFETQDSNLNPNPNPFCPKCRLQEFNPNPNPFHFFLDTRI